MTAPPDAGKFPSGVISVGPVVTSEARAEITERSAEISAQCPEIKDVPSEVTILRAEVSALPSETSAQCSEIKDAPSEVTAGRAEVTKPSAEARASSRSAAPAGREGDHPPRTSFPVQRLQASRIRRRGSHGRAYRSSSGLVISPRMALASCV